jgi:hypothetical protein
VSARVSPETYKFLKKHPDRLGLLIDGWVRLEQFGLEQREEVPLEPAGLESEEAAEGSAEGNGRQKKGGRETIDFDADELLSEAEFDPITEQARGLLALVVERGTAHLTEAQVEKISDQFSILVNTFTTTFKRRS